jgi:hypothetical protein
VASQEGRWLRRPVGGEAPGATGAPRSGGAVSAAPGEEAPSRPALTSCLERPLWQHLCY